MPRSLLCGITLMASGCIAPPLPERPPPDAPPRPRDPGLPTPAEVASTPRDDVELEYVALRATPERWVADEEVYDTVVQDVAAIRAEFEDVGFALVPLHDSARGMTLEVPPDDSNRADAHARFLELTEGLGGDATVIADEPGRFFVVSGAWPGLFQPSKLLDLFDAITPTAGVRLGHADADLNDGPRIEVVLGDPRQYLFLQYGGDCPEGCTSLQAWLFEVDANGAPSLVDTYDSATATECPPWLQGRRCPIGE